MSATSRHVAGYLPQAPFAGGYAVRGRGRIGLLVGPGRPGQHKTGSTNGAAGHLLSCVSGNRGFAFDLMLVYVVVDTLTGMTNSLFLRALVSSCVAPLLNMSGPIFADVCHSVTLVTKVCLVNIITACICGVLVISVSRNVRGGVHSRLFTRVRALPVGCFSARTRKSIVDHCAGSVSALHRVLSRDVPVTFSSLIAVIDMFTTVLTIDLPLALVIVIVITLSVAIAGAVNNGDSIGFIGRRRALNGIGNCVRRVVRKRGRMGIFKHRARSGRHFSGLGSRLHRDTAGTGVCTGVLVPVLKGLKCLRCTLVTVFKNTVTISNVNNLALNTVTSFLRLDHSFAVPIGRVSRRISSVIVTLTKTRQVFRLVSRGPRLSRNAMALMGIAVINGRLVRTRGRAKL